MHPNHSAELASAFERLGVTVDLLQGDGDRLAQSEAAASIVRLSDELRAKFELIEEPFDEQERIFWKKLHWTAKFPINQAQLSGRQLAHFTDGHMKMIRDVGTQFVKRIRRALDAAQLEPEPDVERGIFTATLKGLKAGTSLPYAPHEIAHLTVGQFRTMDERYVLGHYGLDAQGMKYARAMLQKAKILA